MWDYELELFDRVNAIKDTITYYGEHQFYIAFSGGRDSTILHHLVDMALPGNKIPRVFLNTGVEYDEIVKFFRKLQSSDDRFIMLQSRIPIIKSLQDEGYPFKSKDFAQKLDIYQRNGLLPGLQKWLSLSHGRVSCPQMLRYLFTPDGKLPFRVSDKCCEIRKERPLEEWSIQNNKRIAIVGLVGDDKGRRTMYQKQSKQGGCFVVGKETAKFYPLRKVDHEWEDAFIERESGDLLSILSTIQLHQNRMQRLSFCS